MQNSVWKTKPQPYLCKTKTSDPQESDVFYYSFVWHAPLMAHSLQEHPQEQEPFPFFLFLIPVIIIARNAAAIIAATITVGQFIPLLSPSY